MHDPAGTGEDSGDVFLAIGVSSVARAVDLATAARSRVVLVHADTEADPEVSAVAVHRDLGILLVDPTVSWSQISAVVYGLVFESRETESGRGPGDLFALADTIAAAVGGAVTIEDQLSRVVAYSSVEQGADPARMDTILGRRVPDQVRELFDRMGIFRHLAQSDEPVFVPPIAEHGLHGRMVAAVRAGRELLGSIWVACDEPLSEVHNRILVEGAHTVALHLLRSRVSADLERQVESELVISLLEGTPDASAVVGKLGLPPERFRVIAVQAHAQGERHAAILLVFERATTGFGWSRPGRSTLFGNTVYTLLPCGDDPAPARDWLRELSRGLPGHVTLSAGFGGSATLSEIPASRHEAEESLALHATDPDAPPVCYDESWDRILLQRLRTAAAGRRIPSRGPIVELARHDNVHNTRYLATLRAWLEAQGDLATVATMLDVHPNTVRYRMRRMNDIARLQLDDPKKRLAMLITLAVQDDPE